MAIVLEISADGSLTLPAELLEGMHHERYAVRPDSGTLIISPAREGQVPPDDNADLAQEWDEWFRRLAEIGERMKAKWPEHLTSVEAVNAIRR
jgi:predicted transcriptional regulator